MRITIQHLLLSLALAVLAPAGVSTLRAQDTSYPLQESVDLDAEHERERIIFSPGEADPSINSKVHVPSPKDGEGAKSVKVTKAQAEAPKTSARPASQEDDSILSFNFLYYIFEKYKLQDMVD